MVTLNFLANGGDGYPFPVPQPGRVDLVGERGQFNAPNSDFPDTNGNGIIDGPQAVDPGAVDFADPGSEQDAFAEYLVRFSAERPFSSPETFRSADRHIQNLGVPGRADTVFEWFPNPEVCQARGKVVRQRRRRPDPSRLDSLPRYVACPQKRQVHCVGTLLRR